MSSLELDIEPLGVEPETLWANRSYRLETTGNFLILWAVSTAIKVEPERKYSFVAYDRFARQWLGYILRRENGELFLPNNIRAADKNSIWALSNSLESCVAYIDLYGRHVHTLSFSPNFSIQLPLNSLKRKVLYLVSGTHNVILKCSVSRDGILCENVMSLKPSLTPQIADGLHVAPDDEEFFLMTDKGIAYLSRSGSVIELFVRESGYLQHHINDFFVMADRKWSQVRYTQSPHKGWLYLNVTELDSISKNHNLFFSSLSLTSFFADDAYAFLTLHDNYDLSSYFLVFHKGNMDAYWEFDSSSLNIIPWDKVIILSAYESRALQSKNSTHHAAPTNNGILFYDHHQRSFKNESSFMQRISPILLSYHSLIDKYKQKKSHDIENI